MKLLFVHDLKVIRDTQNRLYTDGSYNNEIWSRYFNLVDKFTVIAREGKNNQKEQEVQNKFNSINTEKNKFNYST